MKVLKVGTAAAEKPKKETCYQCKSKLEFTSSDVQQDRDGRYIVCPVCTSFIAVGTPQQTNRLDD